MTMCNFVQIWDFFFSFLLLHYSSLEIHFAISEVNAITFDRFFDHNWNFPKIPLTLIYPCDTSHSFLFPTMPTKQSLFFVYFNLVLQFFWIKGVLNNTVNFLLFNFSKDVIVSSYRIFVINMFKKYLKKFFTVTHWK